MTTLTGFTRKLGMLLGRRRFRSELDEEMAFHRDEQQRAYEIAGMPPRDARRTARRQFGNPLKLRDQSHEVIGFKFESVWQDVRYAIRQMLRSPGFTLAVVFTMALGIGANTAIFSVVRATLLRNLPYPHAEQIVSISDARTQGSSTGGLVSVPRFFDLMARSKSFDSLACFYFEHPTLIVGTHFPEHMNGKAVTGQYWHVMGVQPVLGRVFDDREDRPNSSEVLVLSYGTWQRLFGSDPEAIGRVVTLDKQLATVIGVMPKDFQDSSNTEIWKPTHFDPANWKSYRGDGTRFINVVGRLESGVNLAAAQNEMQVIGAQLASEYSDTDALWRFQSKSLRDRLYGEVKPALLVLMTASLALLLIACVNVANLLLSRATAREREIAIRQALGASRKRIVRQMFTESILLAAFGGGVGLAAAFALVRSAGAKLPASLGILNGLALDWQVVGFALTLSVTAGIVFGLAPAFLARRNDLNRTLKSGESRVAGSTGIRVRSGFIALQVGLSFMLLVCACLLVKSLWKLTTSPLGFTPDHVLTFEIQLPWGGQTPVPTRLFSEVQQRVESLPGVVAVGQVTALPTEDWHARNSYDVDWKPQTAHKDAVNAEIRNIAGNYLTAMGIPLLAGRELRAHDIGAVLVNREFVDRYLPGGNPVGRHLEYAPANSMEIVGVIGNVRGTGGPISGEVQPEVYFSAENETKRAFVVRSQQSPEQLITEIREQVRAVDPQQSIGNVHTLDEIIDVAVAQPKLNMAVLVSFAAVALTLACVGIYGVVAYSVAQRRQEIGVRMALGASRKEISLLFLRRTIAAASIGLTGGLIASLLLTHLLRSQLYGVRPDDISTYAIAMALLLAPVMAASLRPAMRAASINPVDALRAE
jgi:putative ABC transport system permease protein